PLDCPPAGVLFHARGGLLRRGRRIVGDPVCRAERAHEQPARAGARAAPALFPGSASGASADRPHVLLEVVRDHDAHLPQRAARDPRRAVRSGGRRRSGRAPSIREHHRDTAVPGAPRGIAGMNLTSSGTNIRPRSGLLAHVAAGGKLALAIIFVFPLAWMFLSSLRPVAEIFQYIFPFSLWTVVPLHATLDSYRHLLRDEPFGRYLANSLIVASCVAAFDVAVSSMAAYALARIRFAGREALFFLVLT